MTSFPIIGAAGTVVYFDTKKEQFFMQAIDAVAMTVCMVILLLCEHRKSEKFFEEVEEFTPLNRGLFENSFYPNQSNVSQFPLNYSGSERLLPYPYG